MKERKNLLYLFFKLKYFTKKKKKIAIQGISKWLKDSSFYKIFYNLYLLTYVYKYSH